MLRQLTRIFILSWSHSLQYRGDILIWSTLSVLVPLISLAIWSTVAANSTPDQQQFVFTYYIIAILVEITTRSWRGFYLVNQIRDGKIVKYLIRPPIFLFEFITNNISTKTIQMSLMIPTLIVGAALFRSHLSPAIYDPANLSLFLLSLLLAATIGFFFNISIGLLGFWIEEASEIHGYSFLLRQFASGLIIPLAFMPDWAQTLFSALPFRYIISAPIEILLATATNPLQLIVYQLLWVGAFVAITKILFTLGVRTYAVPG